MILGVFADKLVKLYLIRDEVFFLMGIVTNKSPQIPLNIKVGKGETVTFYMDGASAKAKLHLTGFSKSQESSSTAIGIPFKGQQQSILMTDVKSADKAKKRVSIKESPDANRELTSSDDDDDDDDEEEDEEEDTDEGIQVQAKGKQKVANGFQFQLDSEEDEVQVIPQQKGKAKADGKFGVEINTIYKS
jgi:hypothetical protein